MAHRFSSLWACAAVIVGGCDSWTSSNDPYAYATPQRIEFRDDVRSQPAPKASLTELPLTTPEGDVAQLSEHLKTCNLVVVVMRGYSGAICPYCSTQTSRLIANYDEIRARGAEVVVIYPLAGDQDQPRVQEFLAVSNGLISRPAADKPPFPLLVDVGLKAVDVLGIRKDLSKPATYILDKTGAVRFAYVGESLADRPSIKVLLQQLDALKAASPEPGPVGES